MWGLFVAAPFKIMFGMNPGITAGNTMDIQLMPNPLDAAGPSQYHPRTDLLVPEHDRLHGPENDWYTPEPVTTLSALLPVLILPCRQNVLEDPDRVLRLCSGGMVPSTLPLPLRVSVLSGRCPAGFMLTRAR